MPRPDNIVEPAIAAEPIATGTFVLIPSPTVPTNPIVLEVVTLLVIVAPFWIVADIETGRNDRVESVWGYL